MGRIIQEAHTVVTVTRERSFTCNDCPGAGYGFPVDEDGEYIVRSPEGLKNWEGCTNGTFDVTDHGIVTRRHEHRVPALLRCDCGRDTVQLDGFTNTCEACGRDYNMSGQLLAPRSQWGEETGESLSDILRIP